MDLLATIERILVPIIGLLVIFSHSMIVAILVRRLGVRESAYERLSISVTKELGLAAVLFWLLPLLVVTFEVVWAMRLINIAMAAFIFSYFPIYQRRRARSLKDETAPGPQRNFHVQLGIAYIIGALALASGSGLVPVPALPALVNFLGIGLFYFSLARGIFFMGRLSRV